MTHLLKQVFAIENNWKNVFYVHTPFCIQRCNYCVYSSRVTTSREEMNTFYRRLLPAQLEQYKSLLERKTFDQFYFGGGTPTIIDADTLETVYKQIPNFKAVPIKATEISPYTFTNEHIDLFHRWEFIYVSMGVQTFNKRVLRKENRLVVTVEKLTDICRQLDKHNTISNVDLIFYLGIGEYMEVKPWRNYYYIYTLRDKYMWKEYYRQAKTVCSDFEKTREKLGLPHHKFTKNEGFFTGEAGKEKFKRILKQTGNPYYELNREVKPCNVSREPEKFRENPSINIDFDLD